MLKPVLLKNWQAKAAARDGLSLLVFPVRAIGQDTVYTKPGHMLSNMDEFKVPDGWKLPDLGPNFKCPIGSPPDRLYVKETWSKALHSYHNEIFYRADGEVLGRQKALSYVEREKKWRPPASLKKEDSRFEFEIVSIAINQLKELTEDEAKEAGMVYTDYGLRQRGKMSIDGGRTYHQLLPEQHNGWHSGLATGPEQCLYTARFAFFNQWYKDYPSANKTTEPEYRCWFVRVQKIKS